MIKYGFKVVIMLVLLMMVGTIAVQASDSLTDKLELSDTVFQKYNVDLEEKYLLESLEILNDLNKAFPNNGQVVWRMGRIHNYLAINSDDKIDGWNKAKSYVEQSLELEANEPNAHFWMAVLIGQIGQEKGILTSLFMLKPMREHLERTIEIEPLFDYAYYLIATLYMDAPGWPLSFGDKKKALSYAKQAVDVTPDSFEFQWGLYRAYNNLNNKKEAKKVLETIVSMPLNNESLAPQIKKDAEEALAKFN
ncbi:MAG: hypothetical protein KAX49_05350 [Halanaerobiales bacterium]|nr:hypothetical protein [Halanaerobiales bacterium]